MINSTGGLASFDEEDEDIPIPRFPTNGNSSDDESNNERIDDEDKMKNLIESTTELRIGKPIDKSQAFGTGFIELENSNDKKLAELGIENGDILAFKKIDEDFLVTESFIEEE